LTGVLLLAAMIPVGAADTSVNPSLDPITVHARRERAMLDRMVKRFVSVIALAPLEAKLTRWREKAPICPRVAGVPRDHGEFILRRLSQVATGAGAPLGSEHCQVNLSVVVTADPAALLKAWGGRKSPLFGDAADVKIQAFLDLSSPIRVWYNVGLVDEDGRPVAISYQSGIGIDENSMSRFKWREAPALTSVIVIVDSRLMRGISFSQLADYIAMIGLVKIRFDANLGDAPTILHLFSAPPEARPAGLSAWDQSFLRALYLVDPMDRMQLSEIKIAVLRDVAP
jgi:hypothetical protein